MAFLGRVVAVVAVSFISAPSKQIEHSNTGIQLQTATEKGKKKEKKKNKQMTEIKCGVTQDPLQLTDIVPCSH